jgi:hypothetical protein
MPSQNLFINNYSLPFDYKIDMPIFFTCCKSQKKTWFLYSQAFYSHDSQLFSNFFLEGIHREAGEDFLKSIE